MAEENPFRYSPEHHDEDLGLVYYNYRHYNPTDGRWTSRDPIAEKGGWNLYGFVGNRPISFIDLLGYALAPSNIGSITTIGRLSETFIPKYIETITDHDDISDGEIAVTNRTFLIGEWEKEGERQAMQITRSPFDRNTCICKTWMESTERRIWAQAMTFFRYQATDNTPPKKEPVDLLLEEVLGFLPPIGSVTLALLTHLQHKKLIENKHSVRVWGDRQWQLLAYERKWTIIPESVKTTTGACPSDLPVNENSHKYPDSTGQIEIFLGTPISFLTWKNEEAKQNAFKLVGFPYYQ